MQKYVKIGGMSKSYFKPELLAPAGNLEKLKTAFAFGADAVYVGGHVFGLRKYADNFTLNELDAAIQLANKMDKKVYVVLNGFAHNSDLEALETHLKELEKIQPHAFIIADMGVFQLAKRFTTIPLHVSTQAGVTGRYGCQFWLEAGAKRVILAREVSLDDCRGIKSKVPVELEVFVHGAMCASYSGKCVISNYTSARDSNRGGCIQSCRHRRSRHPEDFPRWIKSYSPSGPQPQAQAEKKGKISENLRISENEKNENEVLVEKIDNNISEIRLELNNTKESSIEIREKKASSGATIDGLKKRRNDLLERVMTELNLEEGKILNYSNLENSEEFPDLVTQEELVDEKKREREKLGSVNLRADDETEKYKTEIKKMEQDRQDLVTAILKLKESITELNQKGRERLLDAFERVNRKFNEVYTKLFNGGSAKLELVDSDDPLDAGLEMLVSPPGKRLQSITLLSGGEQALTALSLIFAVFLTNPSPICVLDEVDAPLDDANVTRFCNLLNELTKITSTRFIIVTHHALTMSKMDRLYGVTMPEKGISQLVAVDLQKAESMVA